MILDDECPKAVCHRCHAVMRNQDPGPHHTPVFIHPDNDCVNTGQRFTGRPTKKSEHRAFRTKRERRASHKGARKAAKRRP